MNLPKGRVPQGSLSSLRTTNTQVALLLVAYAVRIGVALAASPIANSPQKGVQHPPNLRTQSEFTNSLYYVSLME